MARQARVVRLRTQVLAARHTINDLLDRVEVLTRERDQALHAHKRALAGRDAYRNLLSEAEARMAAFQQEVFS